ncbi:hypothetical protein L1887_07160 [Cichorium endivia]|nr:hypothetical protein L1887_07160 [Cichorium endivia]
MFLRDRIQALLNRQKPPHLPPLLPLPSTTVRFCLRRPPSLDFNLSTASTTVFFIFSYLPPCRIPSPRFTPAVTRSPPYIVDYNHVGLHHSLLLSEVNSLVQDSYSNSQLSLLHFISASRDKYIILGTPIAPFHLKVKLCIASVAFKQERDEFQRMVIGNQERLNQVMMEKKKESRSGMEMMNLLLKEGRQRGTWNGKKADNDFYKKIVDAYEEKNQELVTENADLRALLRSMQVDMRDFLNAPNGSSKHPSPVRDADPSQSPLGGRTDVFDLAFHMGRDQIEAFLRNKVASIKLVAVFGPVIISTVSAPPTVGIDLHAEKRQVIFGNTWRHLLRERDFWEHVGGIDVYLAPSSFGQANTRAFIICFKNYINMSLLVHLLLTDLYDGAGVIGLSLASTRKFRKEVLVRCVEINKESKLAFEKTIDRLPSSIDSSITTHLADTSIEPLSWLVGSKVLVVDPPRKGLNLSLISALQAIKSAERKAMTLER